MLFVCYVFKVCFFLNFFGFLLCFSSNDNTKICVEKRKLKSLLGPLVHFSKEESRYNLIFFALHITLL